MEERVEMIFGKVFAPQILAHIWSNVDELFDVSIVLEVFAEGAVRTDVRIVIMVLFGA